MSRASLPAELVPRAGEPGRLDGDAELGALLREANAEYRLDLDEAAAFRRASARLGVRVEHRRRELRAAAALGLACAAAAGWLVWLEAGRPPSPAIVVGPELAPGDGARAAAPHAPAPARPERAQLAAPENSAADGVAPDSARHDGTPDDVADGARDGAPARARTRRHADDGEEESAPRARAVTAPDALVGSARPAPRRERPAPAPERDCLELAREGQPRAAERCFEARAAGSGLGAEMALYEMARLRRDVLHDAPGALAALGAYRERFARGSLRTEVDLSRVELLAELGRGREALRESAALLASPAGGERAAELHWLRADIHRGFGEHRAAAAEYARVEALGGPSAAEASRWLGVCLEASGDIAGARAAYRRYTSQPGRPHAAEIQRRLEQLARAPGLHDETP